MTKAATAALLVAALAMATPCARAQERTKSADTSTETQSMEPTSVKVAVTFTEFEGERKVKSLPYTLIVAGTPPKSVLKMGSRVPLYTGKESGMQYIDVGSNIDCTASPTKDDRFDIKLSLDRSWVEGDVPIPVETGSSSPSSGQFPEPIVRQFRSELSLTLRDGQTVESALATDPLSGKVFKVEVTLNVLK
jgi:hypothetical protein